MIGFFGTLFYLGILGGDVFTYRLTDTHAELAKWNDYIPFAKKLFQIPLCIIAVAIVFMMVTKPESILGIGLGGMVGVGLSAGATLYSSDYEKNNLNYQYFFTDWSLMVQHVEIDKERRVVIFWAADLNTKNNTLPLFAFSAPKTTLNKSANLSSTKPKPNNLKLNIKPYFWKGKLRVQGAWQNSIDLAAKAVSTQ